MKKGNKRQGGARNGRQALRKNRDRQFAGGQLYVVRGFWKHRTWEDQNHQTRHENSFYITDIQTF